MCKRTWYVFVAIAVVLALASGIASAQLEQGKKAPDFTLKTLDGKNFSLKPLVTEGMEQKSAVVLSFWATWCPPCRSEAPHLQKLYEDYDKKGVAVIGVAISDRDLRNVQRFVKENKLAYTILLDPDGTKAALKYRFASIPTLFIIDSKGVIRGVYNGYYPGVEKKIAAQLDGILAEKAKAVGSGSG